MTGDWTRRSGMLAGLIPWWKEQMLDLVPARFRTAGQASRRVLTVVADASGMRAVELFEQGKSGRTSLGRYELSGTALRDVLARLPKARRKSAVLQVSPDLLLQREVELPLAAERDLKRVVAYEMDRLTPFRADEVLWTCVAGRRDTARSRLHVCVTVIPSVRMQPFLAALKLVGLRPVRIEAEGATTGRRAIPLGAEPTHDTRLGARIDACALAVCGGLAVAAAALPFVLQSVAWSGIDAEIEAMRPRVVEAERLRTSIASSATTADAIATARNQVSTPLQAIALLTDALPDDTYLTTLSARHRKLIIGGRSMAAARLIGAMAAHPMLQNPTFTGPVIRDETSGGETFSIRADLGG